MAYRRSALISTFIVLILLFSFTLSLADNQPQDTSRADTSAVADTSVMADKASDIKPDSLSQDTTRIIPEKELIKLPEPEPGQSYYKTYISGKSYGDYLRCTPGLISLQHGAYGQPEMLVKSIMLPGLNVTHIGVPIFHQGTYFPFRSGTDLSGLMFEDVSSIEIAPLSYLDLFSQGEVLALNSMVWPADNNPSSLTVGRGPFGYERAGWRFSRRFSETVGATFTAGFEESDGYYSSGADYDAFAVTGSLAWRIKPNIEIGYHFFQHKAKQGILQFDRLIAPTIRSNNDQNLHIFKSTYKYSEYISFDFELFRQRNYNHVFDNGIAYSYKLRDSIWGGRAAARLIRGNHNFCLQAGGGRHYFANDNLSAGRSVTMGLVLEDSIAIDLSKSLILTARPRHNNIDEFSVCGTGRLIWALDSNNGLDISVGRLDNEPDIYALYFRHPVIIPSEQDLINSYNYYPNSNLKSKKLLFTGVSGYRKMGDWLTVRPGLTLERVSDDLVPEIAVNDGNWISSQRNVDYNRVTFTMGVDYKLTKYFHGSGGFTYFLYDPSELLPQVKYSPSVLAHSFGELKVEQVLRDMDLSGAFQIRYLSSRDYSGLVSLIMDDYSYKQVVVIDGSLAVRFGVFEFRLTKDNILDFITGNDYSIWGAYFMPPGAIWWTFTWDFEN